MADQIIFVEIGKSDMRKRGTLTLLPNCIVAYEAGLEALTQFGHHFGLAFQITDDILDVTGDQNIIGKPVGSDEKNVRTTYISLFGVQVAKEKAELSVQACLESLAIFGADADFLRDLARFTLGRTS